jgi:ABC-type transporter lipoprotein component MlaA/pimeloyl-ACP methyl ester carboxylesterase
MACFLTACTSTSRDDRNAAEWKRQTAPVKHTPVPVFMNDPCEPVNRGIWEVNKGLIAGVIQPTARVYRTVVPKRARVSINDFTRNITYPGRVLNHALQGRWEGAGDETRRFVCNTTAGVAGFFDPASKWNIPKSNADFSQTFGLWGWKPHAYVVLPALGPSDDRNMIGSIADGAAEPWSYAYPYRIGSYVSKYNKVTGISEEARRITQSESDSYALIKYAWSYASKDEQPDWRINGSVDPSTMQTLGAVRVGPKDPEFISRSKQIGVRIPTTGRKLKFSYWLQPGPTPLVYISPGLSSHRLSLTALSVAEHLHQNGYSVVTTTSVYHPEFMENASTAALPAYPPVDSQDLLVAITGMDRALVDKYPGRFTKRALVGLSMGGFLTLRIAANEAKARPDLLRFDRYVAINAPVDLVHGARYVDALQDAPMAWPASQRQALVNNALHKATLSGALTARAETKLPFDAIESKYLIGLTFRITLRDIIFSSQLRNNMGVLETPLSPWRRESCYQEIMDYSYQDYFLKFVVPFYQKQGVGLERLMHESNLRSHESKLRRQSKIRVLANRNDFLLPQNDLSWLRSTFSPSQLTVFPDGGHLGNLGDSSVRNAILGSLGGLQ